MCSSCLIPCCLVDECPANAVNGGHCCDCGACMDFLTPCAASTNTPTSSPTTCRDDDEDEDFRQRYTGCTMYASIDCTLEALSSSGFNADDVEEIRSHCPDSCGLCTGPVCEDNGDFTQDGLDCDMVADLNA